MYNCPWCNIGIEIIAENCKVFRCGIIKQSGLQLNPHLSEKECNAVLAYIYGCGKPFQLYEGQLIKCDYI
jgi:hypothetical protein